MSILLILHVLVSFLTIAHLLLFSRRSVKAISWFLILLIFPGVGVGCYFIFGMNRRKTTVFPLKQQKLRKAFRQSTDIKKWISSKKEKFPHEIAKIISKHDNYSFHKDTSVDLFHEGKMVFKALFDEIKSAKKFVHIQYYLLEEGKLLDELYEICVKLKNRGVEIRVLYDAIGSYEMSRKTINNFKEIGVEIIPILPLKWGTYLYTLNFRNHRKIVIIDGEIAFTGGFNFSDKYIISKDELGIWKDTHLKLKGDIVQDLQVSFAMDYYYASDGSSLFNSKYFTKGIASRGTRCTQLVSGEPDAPHPMILHQYLTMINEAKEVIYVSNPYIIPNSPLLEAIRNACLRSVKVKLLVPQDSDGWVVKYSTLSFFEELLEWGVDIYIYGKRFIHKKVIAVDNKVASVGSGNFDHRSFEHNFESNIILYDKELSMAIIDDFEKDFKDSKKLELEQYKQRSLTRKFKEGFARLFSPLL